METLNVGMYIRTKDGIIDKVIIDYNGHCASPNCECKHVSCAKNYYDEDKIVKARYNIIDLIEVGDIISFYEDIDNYKKQYVIGIPDLITLDLGWFELENMPLRYLNLLKEN